MRRKTVVSIICLLLSVLISIPVLGAESAGQPVPWLNWSAGAKAISLGRSQTTIDARAAAIILNPADLGWREGNYLTMMHTQSLEGISYDFGGLNYQIKRVGVGVGYQSLNVEDISEYDQDGNFIGFFKDQEQAFSLAVGLMVQPQMSLGGAVRIIRQVLYDQSSLGYGMDLGFKWQPAENVIVGGLVTNLMGNIHWSTDEVEKAPFTARIGVQYILSKYDLTVMGEYLHDEGDLPFHFGIEKGYKETLRLRAGLDGMTPTFGVGLIMARLEVDYAFVLDMDLGKRQYLSLNWRY